MRRIALWGVAGLIACLTLAASLQHAHYHAVRRDAAQDRQPWLHDGEVFHVLTFVRVSDGGDLIASLQALHGASTDGDWVYVGKALFTTPSAQIGRVDWSAVVLTRYPSREAYEADRRSPAYGEALGGFVEHYEHGMRRSALANLMLPQVLLMRKFVRIASFTPSPYPFTPSNGIASSEVVRRVASEISPDRVQRVVDTMERLRGEPDLGREAVVVVNLIRRGTPEQAARDARYTDAMIGLMAERGYGPLHVGDAMSLSEDIDFDTVAMVYYPGTEFFADMISSTFFRSIVGDKQLGDNQSTATVPILELVEG